MSSRYFDATQSSISFMCWRCGEVGHRSFECTSRSSQAPRCFLCAEKGHISSNCPAMWRLSRTEPTWDGPSGSEQGAVCVACGEPDHVNCAFAPAQTKPKRSCPKCGDSGHDEERCRQNPREDDRRVRRRLSEPVEERKRGRRDADDSDEDLEGGGKYQRRHSPEYQRKAPRRASDRY